MEANNINKLPSENFLQYLDRLLELKDKNEIDLDKSEIYELVFENSLSSCEARKRLYLWRDVKKKAELENIDISEIVNRMSKVDIINNKLNENVTENEILQEIKQKEEELLKEKYKIQTEKQELNKWRREEARVELYFEKMEQFAKSQRQNIVIPTVKIENKSNIADAIITIADMHYGSEYIVHGLQNEILNQYNPQVFEQRMWNLFNKIISKVSKEQLTHINLFNLSDSIDGILHISQLQSLSFGVVESIIKFQEFMTTWLNELSKYVSIDYFANDGNHCELRVLTGKKNDLPNENAERLITRYLKCALQNNPNITIHETNSGMHYVDILGTKVLSIHGQDERNLEQSIKDYMMMYEVKIDMLLCGHLHTSHEKVIGMTQKRNIEFIQSPSLCGINPYSTSIKKGAKSGSKMILLTQDYEEKVTYDFILN